MTGCWWGRPDGDVRCGLTGSEGRRSAFVAEATEEFGEGVVCLVGAAEAHPYAVLGGGESALVIMAGEPFTGLGFGEPFKFDVGKATSGANGGFVELFDALVGGEEKDDFEALTNEAVEDVEEPCDFLAFALFRVGDEVFVGVVEEEDGVGFDLEFGIFFGGSDLVFGVGKEAEHVAARPEEFFGVDDVGGVAPRIPGTDEAADGVGFSGAGGAVEND